MYNAQKPTADELPSTARLIKSTIMAAVAALAILTTVVLPAEYGIDPTRIGNALGLTEMGEIKAQLAKEAARDHQMKRKVSDESSFLNNLFNALVRSAHAHTNGHGEKAAWTETLSFTLAPGEGTEIKLVMKANAQAQFLWTVDGGKVNYDLHADGSGKSISYKKGRGVDGDEGTIKAAFAGNHGWFWRSRNRKDVTVTLHVRGDFQEIKRDK